MIKDNIKLYPLFRIATDFQAWIPVFILYRIEYLTLVQVLQLSALYNLAIVVLEVPSGYLSDRIGRKVTLSVASLCVVIAHSFFLIGGEFTMFLIGQLMLAVGITFQSGTDTAFHYDSLVDASLDNEYGDREARVEMLGRLSKAVATLFGGILGFFDLRFAYVLALCGSIVALTLSLRMTEPEGRRLIETGSFLQVLANCLTALKQPVLAWLFVFMTLMTCLAHITFEFYQPYIRLLNFDRVLDFGDSAALVSGLVISVSSFAAAIAAGLSMRIYKNIGLLGVIGLAAAIQLSIVAAWGFFLLPALVALVFIRNLPVAMILAPVNATIAPLIGSEQRATYLSLQSLAARFFFAVLLFSISLFAGGLNKVEWESFSIVLQICLLIGLVCTILLLATSRKAMVHK